MDAIGRPVRILVSTRSMGKLYELLAGYIHYKNVKVSRLEPACPCKRYMLAIRIPGWIHRVPFATSQAGDVRAVYIHSIYLRCTSAPRREDDVRAGLRIGLGSACDRTKRSSDAEPPVSSFSRRCCYRVGPRFPQE